MRQHDPLRLTGGPRREDDGQQIVTRDLVQTQPANQRRTRQDVTGQRAEQLVGQRDLVAQILEHDQFGSQLEAELLHHLAAGQHVPDAGLVDTRLHDFLGDGVVQIDGHALVEAQGRVGHNRRDTRRQQDAHIQSRRHPARNAAPTGAGSATA